MHPARLRCGDRSLDLQHPCVMGVLNVTPDSFSDGGRYDSTDRAVERAAAMVAEGAALIDVGGESTRPGATEVTPEIELQRVIPVIERVVRLGVVVSVDTRCAVVMRAAIDAGAGMVNDVSALRNPQALETVAASGAAVCLMHMLGEPRSMQVAPRYDDVVTEVKAFLAARVQACRSAGIADERLVVDPGFGFGKTLEHNLQLLRGLDALCELGLPLLAGLSRKSMLGSLTGRGVDARLAGSVALALLAVQGGARIIRAHDVAATVDVLKVWSAVSQE
jgi:dihydropteroate synthase